MYVYIYINYIYTILYIYIYYIIYIHIIHLYELWIDLISFRFRCRFDSIWISFD